MDDLGSGPEGMSSELPRFLHHRGSSVISSLLCITFMTTNTEMTLFAPRSRRVVTAHMRPRR